MKYFFIALCTLMCLHSANSYAKRAVRNNRDSIARGGLTLIFITNDTVFEQQGALVKKQMENAFFKVYPEEIGMFNINAARTVIFVIDPTYNGVAATTDNVVHFNPSYMLGQPTDVDVVTHEVMHIVQAYGNDTGPGWLTEGIADYARYKFGVDNVGANWSMPDYQKEQSYTDSYRITARFLVWLENKVKPGIVKELDDRMRKHIYHDDIWQHLTGKSLDELWVSYAANPSI